MAFDIERQNLRNELLSEKRVNESIGQKLKYLNEENKKKDGFIQTYIVGKKLSQDDKFMLKEFFEQFSLDFPKEGLMEVMYAERKLITELESTNRRLQDELHTLRTRWLLQYIGAFAVFWREITVLTPSAFHEFSNNSYTRIPL